MIASILGQYGIHEFTAEQLVSGLINRTWKITSGGDQYILQRVNDHVFKKPYDLADNMHRLDTYLKKNSPDYLFVASINSVTGEPLVHVKNEGYYRLLPFVKGSHTINVATSVDQAFEASYQFGKFTRLLAGFDAGTLHITIPNFHNLTLRNEQFDDAVKYGNPDRIKDARELINEINTYKEILGSFRGIQKNVQVRQRVTHHDTKISNVLFNDGVKGLCVIDLDTVMSGYFISDVGDMMRTYLSPANEEEKDLDKIEVREDYFRAIVHGYLATMRDELTPAERGLIYYAGTFLIYMQAIRFLADHCNNDSYYGAGYEGHNFMRAKNQMKLLQKLTEKKPLLLEVIADELKDTRYYHN